MLTRLATFASEQVTTVAFIVLRVRVICLNPIPLLTTIVGVSFAIIVNDKVILVKTIADNLLVLILVDLLV